MRRRGELGGGGRADDVDQAPYRYNLVFLLVLVLVVFSILAPEGDWSRAVAIALESLALLVAVATSRARSEVRRARAAAVSAGALALVVLVASGALSTGLASLAMGLLAAAIPFALIRGLLRLVQSHGVTGPAVSGALTIYLLLGLLFAGLVGFVARVDDAPYFAQGTDGSTGDRVYFSITTMTTTGFGDYTPASSLGRALAVVEMLFGQIYLVTVIGILVGNLVRRKP
jgi:hypothetical protein